MAVFCMLWSGRFTLFPSPPRHVVLLFTWKTIGSMRGTHSSVPHVSACRGKLDLRRVVLIYNGASSVFDQRYTRVHSSYDRLVQAPCNHRCYPDFMLEFLIDLRSWGGLASLHRHLVIGLGWCHDELPQNQHPTETSDISTNDDETIERPACLPPPSPPSMPPRRTLTDRYAVLYREWLCFPLQERSRATERIVNESCVCMNGC